MWAFFKRILLFGLVNALILVTISIVFNIVTTAFGIQIGAEQTIWIFYAMLGFGGALINLAISRKVAKWTMGVKIIDPRTSQPTERWVLDTVYTMAQQARLSAMPEVGIYESPDINAFATGPSKRRSLVAVSTGLLQKMDKDGVEGVIGHEVAHIANGDMVTMTLLQGVINTLVLIFARILSSVVAGQFEERSRPAIQMVLFYVLQIILSLLGSLVVCYFSRAREYRADAGGARLAGRERMLAGLKSLRQVYGHVQSEAHEEMATLQISGSSASSFLALFATHPPLEERIRKLETARL